MAGASWNCCCLGTSSVYTIRPCHFMQSHICKVYACLALTCHLHFWQNDRDLLRATAVTQGWNGYQNKSWHIKLTLEKKILPLLLQGFNPVTFQSWVWRSNHWAILLPMGRKTSRWPKTPPKLLSCGASHNFAWAAGYHSSIVCSALLLLHHAYRLVQLKKRWSVKQYLYF